MEFFAARPGPDGAAVSARLGPPEARGSCWFRCEWVGPGGGKSALEKLQAEGWVRAWHGCKMESVYSILYHGRFCESGRSGRGDRFFDYGEGVYLHRDRLAHKTQFYSRFTPFLGNGTYVSAIFECLVNREDKVQTFNGTDQWINRSRSVRLSALWLCCRTKRDMVPGDEVAAEWVPEMEANPHHTEWDASARDRGASSFADWLVPRPAAARGRSRRADRAQSSGPAGAAPPGEPAPAPPQWQEAAAGPARSAVAERLAGGPAGRGEEGGGGPPGGAAPAPPPGPAGQEPLAETRDACAAQAPAMSPRALDVVASCTLELAQAHGVDAKKGFEFTAEKLLRAGLGSAEALAAATDTAWPLDRKGRQVLPEPLRNMLRERARLLRVSEEDSLDRQKGS
ncbi:unnamed protein product [Prorocentrum cordatum]|nr:unnamed protein product [Polarella glacialis]